ncbi:hypothetical protein ACT2FY_05455 [Paraburkholderia fungorum]|uniref:hypothetical protein n=1 Tax=Paraburkholderia fungorum TaxID=134537 RepID=UPI00402B4724
MTAPSRLPREIQEARARIRRTITDFDRLKFRTNHPEPHMPVELRNYMVEPENLRNNKNKFQPVWQSKFDLLQPTAELLREFIAAIGTRYRVELCEAELNMDWITRTTKDAKKLQEFVLERVIATNLREPVYIDEGTVYFARLTDGNGNKRPRNFVIYADEPSKRANASCCHLEWRFCGPAALASIYLYSLEDCINFDHHNFWTDHLRLFALPSLADIARWLAQDSADVSATTLTKRANAFKDQYRLHGAFILQDCRRKNPSISDILMPVDNALFIPK